jgi:PAS domain S-box-containing protein
MIRNFDPSSDFRALFEGAPNLYLVLTPDLKIVAVSDAYCRATMTDRKAILERGIFDVFPDNPADSTSTGVSNLRSSLERVLKFRRPDAMAVQKYDIPKPKSEGGGFDVRYWSPLNSPVVNGNGDVSWIIHRVEDVTELTQLQMQGIESKRLHQEQLGTIAQLREANRTMALREEENVKLQQNLVARSIELQTEITERKKTEDILKRESAFYDIVVNNIPAMVFVKDAKDHKFRLVNRAGEQLLGIDRSELLGKNDFDFFPKEQAEFFIERDNAVFESGEFQVTPEEPITTRHNGIRILHTTKIPVFDEEGQPQYLVALHQDITERRQAEIALRESEARLQFLDALGKETAKSIDAVEILATTTRMLGQHLNVAICAYADMEPDQDHFTIRGDWSAEGSPSIVGYYSLADFGQLAVKNLGAGLPLIINDNLAELAPEEAATFQGIGIAATICVPLVKEGRLTALMAIHDRKPRIWNANDLALLSEVTERSWAHIERVRSEISAREGERRLVQAQKMEAIGNLTGGVAHDFNNLLGIIIGNLDLLRGQLSSGAAVGPKIDQLANEALDAALRGADLTRRLLAFARRQSLQPQRVDVNQIVEGISKLVNRTLGDDIEIKLNLGADVCPVNADPSQLGASLINIVNNARDAMPKGGELTIATANRHLDKDYTALYPELAPGNYTLIEVSDTGTGIAPEALNHIFEPFFTTKEQGKGTGLGLSMVFGFVKQSAGHINVYSEVGHGTTFRLYLPCATTAADSPEAIAVSEKGGHETILAVEDNEGLRRVVVRQLGDLGYRVLEAEDGNAAFKILESKPVDLLFTDIMMPGGMSGYDLAQRATSRWQALKVLLTSGFPETRLNGNGNGGSTVKMQLLTKPYRKDDLARALRKVLDAS